MSFFYTDCHHFFVAFFTTVGIQAPALGNDTLFVRTIKYLRVLFTRSCGSKMIFFRKAIYSNIIFLNGIVPF